MSSTLAAFASEEAELFFSVFLQEVSGDDDIVNTSVEVDEVNEGVVEKQEVALESTGEVIAKDSPVDGSDSGDAMADKTLGVTVPDEAVLVMADEAVQVTTSIMAEEVPGSSSIMAEEVPGSTSIMAEEVLGSTSIMAEEVPGGIHVSEAYGIASVMVDEALTGMAEGTRFDAAHEVITVVANFNIAIIVGSAAEDDHDQDVASVDSEETILDEPQPLQIIPFSGQHDEPRTIDLAGSQSNPPFARMASVMEGISLFGVAPRFERVLREESSPMVVSDLPSSGVSISSQVPTLEGTPIQDADDGGMADTEVRGVDVVPEGDISLVDEINYFIVLCLSPLFVTHFFVLVRC